MKRKALCFSVFFLLLAAATSAAQQKKDPLPKSLQTPLPAETLGLLGNELSGQIIYNNLIKLAGAPWVRREREFPGTFYESQTILDMVREYGIETAHLEKRSGPATFDYPAEGELWIVEPQKRLVARLEADPALVAARSRTGDVTGELVYLAPANQEPLKKALEAGPAEKYRGKVALMWSHPSDEQAKWLAAAGIHGVISFNSRERYFDPNQVVYSSGAYDKHDPLTLGFSISWRQWSELLEDLHLGKKVVVRLKARVDKRPDKFEIVYASIPGTDPEGKGVAFTAHLFDGYVKRGANDNMSGCVIELEILRALQRLIASGALPRPRRTIHFIWTAEISGTYAFLEQHPGFADRLTFNLNLDMVGEGLRQCNGTLRMSECPYHLPCYLDGLAKSMLSYVWRTNDVIFQSEGPRGRPGGQYFPIPLVEKNGSLDAFHFSIHPTLGGSDQVCFNNPSVAVPAMMLLVWPDQWYHADTDTPDKSDPTQLKRMAFIGAACAWAAAQCTDDVAAGLAEAASDYGYLRVAERELPRAMAHLESADSGNLAVQTMRALKLVTFGAGRELAAVRSIEDVFSGSPAARGAVERKARQWDLYGKALRSQVLEYARSRAAELRSVVPGEPPPDELAQKCSRITPAIAPAVKGRQFNLSASAAYQQYVKDHPKALEQLEITRGRAIAILNYVNGRRSVAQIADCVAAELDEATPLGRVLGYLEVLKSVGWVVF